MFLALICCFSLAFALTPVRVQSMDATVTIEGKGTITGELQPGQTVTLSLLSFKETERQEILSVEEELYIGDKTITATSEFDDFNNRYAVFVIDELPAEEFSYKIKVRLKTSMDQTIKDYSLSKPITEKEMFAMATEYIESDSATIRSLASKDFTEDSALQTIGDVSHWVNTYVTYTLSYAGKIVPATEVLRERQGVCDEYSNLAAAILRAKGIPVRFVVGMVFSGEQEEYHAWLQAYLPNQGWIDLDPTYHEAGIVDGTHLLMGQFQDHSQAADKASYPANINLNLSARVLFEPGLDENRVQIHSYDEFPEYLNLVWDDNILLKSGQPADLNFILTNNTPDVQLVPVRLTVHQDFEAPDRSDILLLQPHETRELSFRVLPRAEVPEGAFLIYDYLFDTPAQSIQGRINLLPQSSTGFSQIEVESIVPLIGDDTIELLVELKNYSNQEESIHIDLEGIRAFDEVLPAQSMQTFVYVLPKTINQVTISITGNNLNYESNVPLMEGAMPDGVTPPVNGQPPSGELYVPEKAQQELLMQALTYGIIIVIGIAILLVLMTVIRRKPAAPQ